MALLAVLKIRIGYLSYEISRHHHPTFLLFPSDILSFFIRHRFNNQRCSIAAHPLAFRAIYTHERTSFTHTTTTYTHERKSFTHTTTSYTHKRNQSTRKNSSSWLICEPQMPHFVPLSDLFTNKFDTNNTHLSLITPHRRTTATRNAVAVIREGVRFVGCAYRSG